MKLTSSQLRRIIKEEVKNVTQGKKQSAAAKFDAALKSASKEADDDFSGLADKAVAAVKSGKAPSAVWQALRTSTAGLGGGQGYDPVDEILDLIDQKDPTVADKLRDAVADMYGGGTSYDRFNMGRG
jgi:hypothetical protein